MRMMHDRLIEKQFWYNLYEISGVGPYESSDQNLEDLFHDCTLNIYTLWFSNNSDEAIHIKLLNMIWQRFYDHYIVPSEYEFDFNATWDLETQQRWQNLIDLVLLKMTNIFVQTKERYIKLIKLYTAEESNLMNGISTTTSGVARFNDTPQNLTDGDEFGDNTHVSNISKNSGTTTTDADTKIARLDEIRRKLPDLYKEWTDEFEQMFIEKENIV